MCFSLPNINKEGYLFIVVYSILYILVVYGYFSVIFLSSSVKQIASFFGLNIHLESALVGGLSIGIMILPFIIFFTGRCGPKSLRYGFSHSTTDQNIHPFLKL